MLSMHKPATQLKQKNQDKQQTQEVSSNLPV